MATVLFPVDVTMTPAAQKLHDAGDVTAPGLKAPMDLTIFASRNYRQNFIVSVVETVCKALSKIGTVIHEIAVAACSKDGRADGSITLTSKNTLSVAHTLVDGIFCHIANLVYRRHEVPRRWTAHSKSVLGHHTHSQSVIFQYD